MMMMAIDMPVAVGRTLASIEKKTSLCSNLGQEHRLQIPSRTKMMNLWMKNNLSPKTANALKMNLTCNMSILTAKSSINSIHYACLIVQISQINSSICMDLKAVERLIWPRMSLITSREEGIIAKGFREFPLTKPKQLTSSTLSSIRRQAVRKNLREWIQSMNGSNR